MSSLTESAVREALEAVIDPVFEKPLGELGTLLALTVEQGKVSCKVALASPSETLRDKVRERIDAALEPLSPGHVAVDWEVRVPTRETVSDDPIPTVKNVILVMSGKGGVGKSTVATNLALALRRLGSRVGLLDADLYGPSIPTMMGIQGHPASKDGKTIEPMQRFGLKLMSVGFLLEDPKQAVIWRGPMLHGALQQFVRDVAWGELDYLVVDLPPGTGDVALTLAQKMRITGVVVVTTPQEVALADVYKGVSMCKRLSIPILGVVENMSWFEDPSGQRHELFGSGGGEKVAEMAEAPLLGQIPIDPEVRKQGDEGLPIVQAAPSSPAGDVLHQIAEKLTDLIAKLHFERSGGDKAPKAENAKRLRIVR
ncbi:MAG: Mrp/NBP35 family ATP-binding protein [Deltaproteobacteria bacterium]|nr:Mrp/NBP35 family ATP-binding protein [Deltaproteobacteria bacterium]